MELIQVTRVINKMKNRVRNKRIRIMVRKSRIINTLSILIRFVINLLVKKGLKFKLMITNKIIFLMPVR